MRSALVALCLATAVAGLGAQDTGLAAQDAGPTNFARTALKYYEEGDTATAWSFVPLACAAGFSETEFVGLEAIVHDHAQDLLRAGDPLALADMTSFLAANPRFATSRILALIAKRDSPEAKEGALGHLNTALALLGEASRAAGLDPDMESLASGYENEVRVRFRAIPGIAASDRDAVPDASLPAVALGLGFLALSGGGIVLGALHARNKRFRAEQLRSTSEALSALRVADPRETIPDTPDAPDETLRELMHKCGDYAFEIERATSRPGSSHLVADLVRRIALATGMEERDSLLHYCAALVYDIGFLSIDADILDAPSIGEEEFKAIREHPRLGLNRIFFVPQELRPVFRQCVLMHHENLDGSGYPDRLAGHAIPFIARAVRVAESYLAIVSGRGKGKAEGREEALAELAARKETYDAAIVKMLATIVAEEGKKR